MNLLSHTHVTYSVQMNKAYCQMSVYIMPLNYANSLSLLNSVEIRRIILSSSPYSLPDGTPYQVKRKLVSFSGLEIQATF